MKKISQSVVSGTWGTGKSAVLDRLTGIAVVPEPGRSLVAERPGLQDDGPAFAAAVLQRSIEDFRAAEPTSVFDRGVVDAYAYSKWMDVDEAPYRAALDRHRYGPEVLFFPFWPDIYVNDDLRLASPELAERFEAVLIDVYESSGYSLVEVPRLELAERVAFVRDWLNLA